MDGDVTVRVEWSTLNYKDGLAITGKAPVVRRFPMIAGIDFAGTVEAFVASRLEARRPGHPQRLGLWRDPSRRLRREGAREGRLAGAAAGRHERARRDGDRHRGLHRHARRDGARAIRAHAGERSGGGDRARPAASARSRSRFWPSVAFRSRPRPVGRKRPTICKRSGATEIIERKELSGPAATAGQGALGRRHRFGRFDDARQRAVDDALWRRGGGLRSRRRYGSCRRPSRPSSCAAFRCSASIR